MCSRSLRGAEEVVESRVATGTLLSATGGTTGGECPLAPYVGSVLVSQTLGRQGLSEGGHRGVRGKLEGLGLYQRRDTLGTRV